MCKTYFSLWSAFVQKAAAELQYNPWGQIAVKQSEINIPSIFNFIKIFKCLETLWSGASAHHEYKTINKYPPPPPPPHWLLLTVTLTQLWQISCSCWRPPADPQSAFPDWKMKEHVTVCWGKYLIIKSLIFLVCSDSSLSCSILHLFISQLDQTPPVCVF